MLDRLTAALRPPGWPELPQADRRRVRALAWFAALAQALFVVGWVVGGALERGYSPLRMYISELGRRGAAHPWIFYASVALWGAGFIALGFAIAPGLRMRPWRHVAPALFVLAGLLVIAEAPLRLDCAASVDRVCSARQAAGALSWHHYAHQSVSFAIVVVLALTPFALARAEWPSRLARLTLRVAVAGAVLLAIATSRHEGHGDVGLWQRIELLVVHGWVLTCAAAVLLEARRTAGGATIRR